MTAAADLASLEVFAGIPAADLAELAMYVEPLHSQPGDVLMRQGERALTFLIVASGALEVRHTDPDGETAVAELSGSLIVGEIALLRGVPRTATVVAVGDVFGYVGGEEAFQRLLEIPGIAGMLVRTARQRLAAFITPIPVLARDDTELFLRPVLPGDAVRVAHSHVQLSPQSMYKRFLSVRRPTEAMLTYLFEVDYVDHFVWVLTDGADGPVIADARFVRDPDDRTAAEIAFTVADLYQGRGLGTLLFAVLAVAARVDGIERFNANVLSDNEPARGVLDRYDAEWVRDEPGVVTTTIPVPGPEQLPVDLPAGKSRGGGPAGDRGVRLTVQSERSPTASAV